MTNRFEWKEWPATPAQLVSRRTDEAVERLKGRPGHSAIVETTMSRQAAKKWRRRGCIVSAFPSDSMDGGYDLYAKWPHPDDV